jgi:phage tail-like protein
MVMGALSKALRGELLGCRFSVEASGIQLGLFQECSGLSAEVEVETYQEGGLNDYEHKLPGRTRYGNVTLKSGVIFTPHLWTWFSEASVGNTRRTNVSIVMYLQTRLELMRWNLLDAYPVRWQGPDFNANDNAVVVHSLELAHNGITLGAL